MNVTLINPNFRGINRGSGRFSLSSLPPLGLAYIASYLYRHGHDVQIIDANGEDLEDDRVIEQIKVLDPQLIGFSGQFAVEPCRRLAEKIKGLLPDVKTVLGGVIPTILSDEIMDRYKCFDFLVKGEGELALNRLIEALEKSSDISIIKGVLFRRNGTVISSEGAADIADIDQLDFPSRRLLRNNCYRLLTRKQTLIICSRGCILNCSYCRIGNVFNNHYRRRNFLSVIEELKQCYREFGIRHFYFGDNIFTLDNGYVLELSRAILNSGIRDKIGWRCQTRPEYVQGQVMAEMKKAGCFCVNFDIEFGIGTQNEEAINDAFKHAKKAGLMTFAFFNFNPLMDEGNFKKIRKLIKRINPTYYKISPIIIHPHSPMYANLLNNGIINQTSALGPDGTILRPENKAFSGMEAYNLTHKIIFLVLSLVKQVSLRIRRAFSLLF